MSGNPEKIAWIDTGRSFRRLTYNLASSSRSTSEELPRERDATSLGVGGVSSDEIVDCELDGLFGGNSLRTSESGSEMSRRERNEAPRTNDELRRESTVEPEKALVLVHLLYTI